MGKRQIGELQPSELVITILISEIASMPIADLDLPIAGGIISILTLVFLELLMSIISLKNTKLRVLFYGRPIILIRNGDIDQKKMKISRVSIDDIFEAMRDRGIMDISEVEWAILETNGKISVFQKKDFSPVTLSDMNIKPKKDGGVPLIMVLDGKVMVKNLEKRGINSNLIIKAMSSQNINSVKDIFLMTIDENQKTYIVKKDK